MAKEKTEHAGDCTIYAAMHNGYLWDGICTCGYGWERARAGDYSAMMSEERKQQEERKQIVRMMDRQSGVRPIKPKPGREAIGSFLFGRPCNVAGLNYILSGCHWHGVVKQGECTYHLIETLEGEMTLRKVRGCSVVFTHGTE